MPSCGCSPCKAQELARNGQLNDMMMRIMHYAAALDADVDALLAIVSCLHFNTMDGSVLALATLQLLKC